MGKHETKRFVIISYLNSDIIIIILGRRGMDRLEEQLNMLALGAEEEEGEASAAAAVAALAGPTFDPLNFDEDLRLARGDFQVSTGEISQNLRALQSFLRETEEGEEDEVLQPFPFLDSWVLRFYDRLKKRAAKKDKCLR